QSCDAGSLHVATPMRSGGGVTAGRQLDEQGGTGCIRAVCEPSTVLSPPARTSALHWLVLQPRRPKRVVGGAGGSSRGKLTPGAFVAAGSTSALPEAGSATSPSPNAASTAAR